MGSPTERVLKLAAWVKERRGGDLTLSRITAAIEEYSDAPRDVDGDLIDHTKEWEALRRQFRRDLADLETYFGIVLTYKDADNYYELEPPFFSGAERQALVAACATVDVDVDGVADAEPGELGGAVDDRGRQAIVWIDRHVVAFLQARTNRSTVTFRHGGKQRRLDPYAVGSRRNRWYVVGYDHDAGEVRQFRLDRIDTESAIEPISGEGAFDLPDDFDAPSALRLDPNDWGTDPLVVARVRVDAASLPEFQRELGGIVVDKGESRSVVELPVRHRASFRVRVTAYGSAAVVVDPPELVADITDWLSAIAGGVDGQVSK